MGYLQKVVEWAIDASGGAGLSGVRSVQYRVEFSWKHGRRLGPNVVGLSFRDGSS